MVFSLTSRCIDAAVRFHLSHSSGKDQKELLDNLGPLATDAARLKLLRVLGWLPVQISSGVESIRRIRNKVSHSLVEHEDLRPEVYFEKDTLAHLNDVVDGMVTAAQGAMKEPDEPTLKVERVKSFSGYGILLAGLAVEAIVSAPSRQLLGVHRDVTHFYGFEDAPAWARNLRRSVARSFLNLSAS